MSGSTTRPLLTFAIVAFNQEEYIREAIQGALSQDYEPLEIILSDDCSTDQTFEIIRDAASQYSGSHQVVVNQNAENLGFVRHVNHVMTIARGAWIVCAGGDDISLPWRCSETYEAWRECPDALSIYSDFEEFGDPLLFKGKFKPRLDLHSPEGMIPLAGATIPGSAHAWHRSVFELFGPLPDDTVSEDRLIPFRAALAGNVKFIPRVTTRVRRHPGSITGSLRAGSRRREGTKARELYWCRNRRALLGAFAKDVRTAAARGVVTAEKSKWLLAEISKAAKKEAVLEAAIDEEGPRARRVLAALRLLFLSVPARPAPWRRRVKTLASAFHLWAY